MLHRVTYSIWDPFNNSGKTDFVVVDAAGGDDAVSAALLTIQEKEGRLGGVRITNVNPETPAPVEDAPVAGIEGAEVEAPKKGAKA